MQLQSRIRLRYQLMFASMQNCSNFVKTYPQRSDRHLMDWMFIVKIFTFPTLKLLFFRQRSLKNLLCFSGTRSIAIGFFLNLINTPIIWLVKSELDISSLFSDLFVGLILIVNSVMGDIPAFSFCGRVKWFFWRICSPLR